jgi:TetR/AcrR family transcriptional regulator, cholesterol catabolism regulator
VPRTRATVDRDAKVEEIVAAARAQLQDGGYSALSVVGIARSLGLAQNAIYWYFPTKDHVFVAAVDGILHDILEQKPRAGTPLRHVLWFADRLHEFQDLRVTMHDRARDSEVVAAYEDDVVELLRVLLSGSLQGRVAAADIDDVADALMALCDGVLLRTGLTRARRRRLIELGYRRLIDGAK